MAFKSELLSDIERALFNVDRNIEECNKTVKLATGSLTVYEKDKEKLKKRKAWLESLQDDCD